MKTYFHYGIQLAYHIRILETTILFFKMQKEHIIEYTNAKCQVCIL